MIILSKDMYISHPDKIVDKYSYTYKNDTHIDFDAQHNDKDCKNKFDDHVEIPKCKRLQSKLVCYH